MKARHLIAPLGSVAIGAALWISAQDATAWTTNGWMLGLDQRDFRVFNSFPGNAANNNQVPDPQFPGQLGAPLAIWKGVAEWGSVAHGDGSGDPTQAVIGSGGANFDSSFQGLATTVGGTNDNVFSGLSGTGNGIVGFTEIPSTNGWRIRFFEDLLWADGPGGVSSMAFDIQSVAATLYGFAIGLGNSMSPGATMFDPVLPGTTVKRSISIDDIAGLQSIYGALGPNKVQITDVTIALDQMTITGANFSSLENEVWFTQSDAGGTGEPVKLTNVASNGTMLTVTIPGGAGPGDVLVRNNGTGFENLSNAWPVDITPAGPCPSPSLYCSSMSNSAGFLGAEIGFIGNASIAANDLTLRCTLLPANVFGIFFYGDNQISTTFGDGLLCTNGNIKRLGVQATDSMGVVERSLDLTAAPFDSGSGQAIAGQSKNFQFWFRDVAGGPAGFNTSNGLAVTWCD